MMQLVHLLSSARDQGQRETCLSMALSDGHHISRGGGPTLAVDYLHHHATLLAGVGANDAVHVVAAIAALETHGQPAETECPYSTTHRPPKWAPPPPKGVIWKRQASEHSHHLWPTLTTELAANRAAVMVLAIDDAFWTPIDGAIVAPLGVARASHAVLAVALDAPSKRVLIRNSWGHEWGLEGYAWLSEAYVADRCTAVISFGGDVT